MQGLPEQQTIHSGTVQGLQQKSTCGKGSRTPALQANSKKRGAIDDEDDPGPPAKYHKTRKEGGNCSSTAKAVGFRPANRTPPTEEDLEFIKAVQTVKSDSEGDDCIEPEKDVGFDPAAPPATMYKRVGELRGDGTRRSSRSTHGKKAARRGEYGLRSGLSTEWSME